MRAPNLMILYRELERGIIIPLCPAPLLLSLSFSLASFSASLAIKLSAAVNKRDIPYTFHRRGDMDGNFTLVHSTLSRRPQFYASSVSSSSSHESNSRVNKLAVKSIAKIKLISSKNFDTIETSSSPRTNTYGVLN